MTTSYIAFSEMHVPGRKTTVTDVLSKRTGRLLGQIKWYGPWRQYCYFPSVHILLNKGCMQDVIANIDQKMAARRA
jgi:hypothetical protein